MAQVLTLLHQAVDDLEHALGVPHGDGVGQGVLHVGGRRAQEVLDGLVGDLARPEHPRLFQERKRIAH